MNENDRLNEWLGSRTKEQLFNIAWDACKELLSDDGVALDDDGAPYWERNGNIIGEKP